MGFILIKGFTMSGVGKAGVLHWNRILNFLGLGAFLALIFNQTIYMLSTLGGAQYVCASRVLPPEGATDGLLSAEYNFFPPKFVCHFPSSARDGTSMPVDMLPFGAWVFWFSIAVIMLVLLAKFFLRRRA